MKKALVCGAGGFIGNHLVRKLKKEGYWVRGVDLKEPEFSLSEADEFLLLDLRELNNCIEATQVPWQFKDERPFDEVYQLAADMGGMGFISSAECEIMRNSALININMVHASAMREVGKYFFSSSACIYRDMTAEETPVVESDAYPALPDNEYGWEKLYAERMAMAYGRKYDMKIRLARFQNTYGKEGTWRGGREKAPAALCRKISAIKDGGVIEVWGDGTAMRAYTYIDDLLEGIYLLMQSDLEDGVNIGSQEYVSVDELAEIVAEIAGKKIKIKHVDGPVGVAARSFSNDRIKSLGWEPKFSLREGIYRTYPWVDKQRRSYDEENRNE